VPVYVNIEDRANLSGLQFLARIVPSVHAPELTGAAQFIPAAGTPIGRIVDGLAPNQIAYAWNLGAFDPPLQGRALLGNVVFSVPMSAHAGQSYRVAFSNADGAPDENTQYEFESFSAGVWVGGPAAKPQEAISDEWKIKFFGSVDSPDADGDADPDGDRASNWKEYRAGTDPTKAQSYLHLRTPEQKIRNGKKHLALRWLSAPGKSYTLETTKDLVDGPWTIVSSGIVGDGNWKEFLHASGAQSTQYYRVTLQK
jgi:hypothetical protein